MNTDTPETQAATYKSANGDGEEIPGADYVEANFALRLEQQRNDAMAKLNAANERIAKLEGIIRRAEVQFFQDGSDGSTAARMLTILNEAKNSK